MLKSLRTSDPKNGDAWIASARYDHQIGKIVEARKIMKEAVHECPDNEDVWIEAAKLQTPDNAKKILAQEHKLYPKAILKVFNL